MFKTAHTVAKVNTVNVFICHTVKRKRHPNSTCCLVTGNYSVLIDLMDGICVNKAANTKTTLSAVRAIGLLPCTWVT